MHGYTVTRKCRVDFPLGFNAPPSHHSKAEVPSGASVFLSFTHYSEVFYMLRDADLHRVSHFLIQPLIIAQESVENFFDKFIVIELSQYFLLIISQSIV